MLFSKLYKTMVNKVTFESFRAVVPNRLYISYPLIKQDHEIYPQYTQWNLHWMQFMVQKIYPLGRLNLPPEINLPQVKDHLFRGKESPQSPPWIRPC